MDVGVLKNYPLRKAEILTRAVKTVLMPYITRFSPVGSIRRQEPFVTDIDLLVEVASPFDHNIASIREELEEIGEWKKGGSRQMTLASVYGEPIQLDLFLAWPPTNFFSILALRTGPEEKTKQLVAGLVNHGYPRPHAQIQVDSEEQLMMMAGLI